jgi:hypothetical protein
VTVTDPYRRAVSAWIAGLISSRRRRGSIFSAVRSAAGAASRHGFDGTPMFADKQAMREQYGKLFADSPDLHLTVASRMTAGDFVVDEEHVSGMHFGDMPAEMTALSVYRVTNGKITSLMLLF